MYSIHPIPVSIHPLNSVPPFYGIQYFFSNARYIPYDLTVQFYLPTLDSIQLKVLPHFGPYSHIYNLYI